MGFHDYEALYETPGLYEHLFYERLQCTSPDVVTAMLADQVTRTGCSVSDLAVLDLGAGNGLVGEALVQRGVKSVIGVDILEEARDAVVRDRPGLYEDYYVGDICSLSNDVCRKLDAAGLNCLTCVAALGFGDIPTAAFVRAFNSISEDGWVAFNIKKDFVEDEDSTGFAKLIRHVIRTGTLDLKNSRTYCHRLAIDGSPLEYVAMVGRKRRHILDTGALEAFCASHTGAEETSHAAVPEPAESVLESESVGE